MKTSIKRHFPALVSLIQLLRSKVKRAVGSTTNPRTMADVFTRAYHSNYWGSSESHSGPGSNLKQTAVIRVEIPKLIEDFGIKSMLDIPCGDFFWMRECKIGVETYIGADIVPSMIGKLNKYYGNNHRRFEVLDLTKDPLPKVDLVLCRDVLVHFSSSDILRAVANLKRSRSTYLLATTFTNRHQNIDLPTSWDWRPLNMHLAPISFPRSLRLINEACTEDHNKYMDKSLGLWRLADL